MSQPPSPEDLRLRLIGPMSVARGGIGLAVPASRKTRAILGYLALSPRPVSRQRLCDLFFDVPNDPRAALRWSLAKIRPLVDTPEQKRLQAQGDAIKLDLEGAEVDAIAVLALATRPPTSLSSAERQSGLELAAAALLEDSELPDRPEYAAWLAAQRQDFHSIARSLAQAEADATTGEPHIGALRRLVALDPLDQTAATALARALITAGRRDEAHALAVQTERHLRQAGFPTNLTVRLALKAATPVSAQPQSAQRTEGADDGRISLAVIPFLNHSPDAIADEHLDGLLESVVHMVSKFRDIRVVGMTKTLQYKGALCDSAVMGASLGASHLAGGSVMVRDGALKLRYRLAAAEDAALLASGDVDHPSVDAFAFLEDIPAKLAVLLAHHLTEAARRIALAKPEAERTAQDHLLVGIQRGFFTTPVDYPASLAAFAAGLRLQPEHASLNAYAGWAKAGFGHALREPDRTLALTQAHMAMTQADADADAMAVAAWAAVHLAQDFEPALRAVDLATRLNPLSRVAWSASAWVRTMAGEFETPMRHWDYSLRCNPLGSNTDYTHCGRALCLWLAGRYAEAAGEARLGLARQPGHASGHMAAVAAAVALGDLDQIKLAARAMARYYPDAPKTPVMASLPIRDAGAKAQLLDAIQWAMSARDGRSAPDNPELGGAPSGLRPMKRARRPN